MNICARAILLDQYESGVHSVDKALQRVVAELGPNSMDEQEAFRLWRRFVDEDFDISYGASRTDCALLKNGTLLRASRALIHSDGSVESCTPCKMSGVDGRFYIGCFYMTNFVVDAFYGIKRKVILDYSDIPIDDLVIENIERFRLSSLHFLNEDRVLGIGDTFTDAIKIFCGTFNFSSCVLKIEKMIMVNNGPLRERYLMFCSTTQKPSILLRSKHQDQMHYAPININDLSLDAMIEVPTAINFPMMLDDKIFGFSEDESVNTQQLIVFSLTSRTRAVYNVETDGLTVNSFSPNSPYTWKEKKLYIARYNWNANTSTVIEFDLQTLKWRETELEVPGRVRMLTLFNNSLMLHGFIWTENTECNMSYRFPFGKCDSLSSTVWNSIHRYSQVHPQFNRWMASKLPNCLRHYLPL